ncbi:MAG: molybdopterin-synthase adenylyltransferase MoeB [Nitrospirae bacterium]|nr:molybdopterin-synthase adenylyltransferase MoeB [Nitrospirota bacterium]
MNFTEEQIQRYSRQIVLKEVGGKGQRKLREAKIFLIGAGGLSSPAALYLAAAGVGTLGIIDADRVDLSNLQRQILHSTVTLNRPKVQSAKTTLAALNADCTVHAHEELLTVHNVESLFRDYDLIIDGTDNFSTRYLVNDAAFFLKKPLVTGSIFRFEGQLTTFFTDSGAGPARPAGGPCYRCLYPEPPPPGMIPSCQEAGVLGVLAGTIGVLQAVEALKLVLGIGQPLTGKLMTYDALAMTFRTLKLRHDPNCALCGTAPRITKLLDDYTVSCTLPPASINRTKTSTIA